MLVVFSFCHKDSALAAKQAQWVKELGGMRKHDAIVVCNQEARRKGLEKIIVDTLSSAFNFVDVFTPHDEDETESAGALKHARSANHMWVRTVQHIRDNKDDVPFLWMESDAVFITPTAVTDIESQFLATRKHFMGDEVRVESVPVHMSGIGVYYKTWLKVPNFACVTDTAWDVALSREIMADFHKTKLIQHDWRPASFESAKDMARIRPEAVLYHQCKDGSLIDFLRIGRMTGGEPRGSLTAERPVHRGEAAGSTPAPETSEVNELRRKMELLQKNYDALVASSGPTVQALHSGTTTKKTRGKPMKRRAITPEHRAKIIEGLKRAREAKAVAMK